ncbi:MAG: rRNA maturation RNase YbeY [Rhodospirillales bacterium]|jgi:probable rRNA maturation factor|nr:rRNA maturation RNase YbeY [Rhodospirillales bacterium]
MSLDIDLSVAAGPWREDLPQAEDIARLAAQAAFDSAADKAALGDTAEASLVLADDEFVQRLNRDYRGRDEATNVLSFAALDVETVIQNPDRGAPVLLGDMVIAFETVAREAVDQDKSVADHFSHLVVHAMLHLLGYDHGTCEQAAHMEKLEVQILRGLGISDPYGEDE